MQYKPSYYEYTDIYKAIAEIIKDNGKSVWEERIEYLKEIETKLRVIKDKMYYYREEVTPAEKNDKTWMQQREDRIAQKKKDQRKISKRFKEHFNVN